MMQRKPMDTSRFHHRWTFTNSARTAWELILRARTFPEGSSILLPAYIGYSEREGSGVFDPVEHTQAPYTFYALGSHLQIDLNLIEDLLRTGRHPMLLVIHYFGLAHANHSDLKELCERYGTTLIEDCAHVLGPLFPGHGMGSFGAAAFYSLHKMFPVPDGGALCLNEPGITALLPSQAQCCSISTLEQVVCTDTRSVAVRRQENYAWLSSRLGEAEGIEVLYPEIGSAVPHDFPIRVLGGRREKLYFALIERGIPAIALYYCLIDQIKRTEYPLSHELSSSILNLPVHQDIGQIDLIYLADMLEEVLGLMRA